MDRINGSPQVQQDRLDAARQRPQNEDKVRPEPWTETPDAGTRPAPGDKAEISETAHRLMDLRRAVDAGRIVLAALPDARENKVELARERLQSGYYDTPIVREKVAAAVERIIRGMEKL